MDTAEYERPLRSALESYLAEVHAIEAEWRDSGEGGAPAPSPAAPRSRRRRGELDDAVLPVFNGLEGYFTSKSVRARLPENVGHVSSSALDAALRRLRRRGKIRLKSQASGVHPHVFEKATG
jgi:hypothetical protein